MAPTEEANPKNPRDAAKRKNGTYYVENLTDRIIVNKRRVTAGLASKHINQSKDTIQVCEKKLPVAYASLTFHGGEIDAEWGKVVQLAQSQGIELPNINEAKLPKKYQSSSARVQAPGSSAPVLKKNIAGLMAQIVALEIMWPSWTSRAVARRQFQTWRVVQQCRLGCLGWCARYACVEDRDGLGRWFRREF